MIPRNRIVFQLNTLEKKQNIFSTKGYNIKTRFKHFFINFHNVFEKTYTIYYLYDPIQCKLFSNVWYNIIILFGYK